MVARYVVRGGSLRPTLPCSCPRGGEAPGACAVGVHHRRRRKTGLSPLTVLECRRHGCGFTAYPEGQIPYARVALVRVAPDGARLLGVEAAAAGDEQVRALGGARDQAAPRTSAPPSTRPAGRPGALGQATDEADARTGERGLDGLPGPGAVPGCREALPERAFESERPENLPAPVPDRPRMRAGNQAGPSAPSERPEPARAEAGAASERRPPSRRPELPPPSLPAFLEGTQFEAARAAARGQHWPLEGALGDFPGVLGTERRWVRELAVLLGVEPGLGDRVRDQLREALGIDGVVFVEAANIFDERGSMLRRRGRAICHLLSELRSPGRLARGLAVAGFLTGRFGKPYRCDPATGALLPLAVAFPFPGTDPPAGRR